MPPPLIPFVTEKLINYYLFIAANSKDLIDQASASGTDIEPTPQLATDATDSPQEITDMYNNNNNAQNGLNANNQQSPGAVLSFSADIDDQIKKKIDEKLKECNSDSDSESDCNAYTPKAVDLPSAQRLAKRLYYLDGFKANDVVRHLSKK